MLERRTVIEGFEIQEMIRSGPRGTVYEAIQGSLLRPVALRILAPELSQDPEFVERFWRQEWPEHPHIVPVYEAGQCAHGLFVAMQLIRGETLVETLAHGAPQRSSALALLGQIASALDAAHEAGLAHGCLRPEAVLLDDGGWAWLSDFGLTPGAATVPSDQAAFAALMRACLGKRAVPKGRWETASALVEAVATPSDRATDRDGGGRRRLRMRR
ncbi:MAG: protein kinase domain-containing protein [Gammaproteobacteria bacterium]